MVIRLYIFLSLSHTNLLLHRQSDLYFTGAGDKIGFLELFFGIDEIMALFPAYHKILFKLKEPIQHLLTGIAPVQNVNSQPTKVLVALLQHTEHDITCPFLVFPSTCPPTHVAKGRHFIERRHQNRTPLKARYTNSAAGWLVKTSFYFGQAFPFT